METTGKHRLTRPATWHDRPVFAPAVYGALTMVTGTIGYTFGFLLMDSIRDAVTASLFLNGLLLLYLRECHKESRRRKAYARIHHHHPGQ